VFSGGFVGSVKSYGNQFGLLVSEYSTNGADIISSSYLSYRSWNRVRKSLSTL